VSGHEQHYRLGPRERRGLVAGWRPGQVVCAALGCALAACMLALSQRPASLVASIVAVAAGISAGTIPIRGRTADEWSPAIWRFARRHGHQRICSIETTELAPAGGARPVGALLVEGSPVVVARLACQGISLLDPDSRSRLVAGLSQALGMLAREGGSVSRLSISVCQRPSGPDQLLRDLRRRGRTGPGIAVSSYRALLEAAAPELPIWIIDLALRGRSERGLLDDACQVLRSLEEAGHPASELLNRDELLDDLAERSGQLRSEGSSSFTLSASLRFDHLDLAGRLTRSWWIAQWPRQEVTAELLAPLLLGAHPLVLSIVVEPVSPGTALRKAQVARTSGAADDEVRRRGGFLADRRRQREAEHLERREAELVDGHGSLRFSGFLAASAGDEAALRERAAAIELAAAQAGLRLQACQGDHGSGLLASLPLTMGLR
jgi:hypothetical protein